MITATFDVQGRNLDQLIAAGHKRAVDLVGGRNYQFDMDVSQRVMTGEGTPASWVAECTLEIEDPVE